MGERDHHGMATEAGVPNKIKNGYVWQFQRHAHENGNIIGGMVAVRPASLIEIALYHLFRISPRAARRRP